MKETEAGRMTAVMNGTHGMSTGDADGRSFIRRHWGAVAIFVSTGVLAFAGAVYVFLWFVGNAQSTGLVPSTLGLWTMRNLVTFILYSVFWELLLIGVPVAVAAVAGWVWWRRLSEEDRTGKTFGGRSRSAGGSGGVSLLFFIAFCVKVYIDGNWDVPIATFTLYYVVGSMIAILTWALIIFGVPVAIGLTWWISRGMKKQ